MRSSNSSPSQARRWLLSGVLGALAAAVLTSLGVHAPVAFGLGRPQRRRPGRAVEQADQPPDQNFDHSLGQTLGQTVGSTCCRGRAGADTGDWSWALRNKQTGEVIGSDNRTTFTNNTESMIKAWIATDYLMDVEASGRQLTATEQERLRKMIHFSDDQAAQWAYVSRGGDAVVQRLIRTCHLKDTSVTTNWWSKTQISARDAVTMGHCLSDDGLLSERWRDWLFGQMRHVDASNAFGIAQAPALAGAGVAIKNGWTEHSTPQGRIWAVNCLAIWGDWSLAVLTNYPAELGLEHGAGICRTVAQQLFGAGS